MYRGLVRVWFLFFGYSILEIWDVDCANNQITQMSIYSSAGGIHHVEKNNCEMHMDKWRWRRFRIKKKHAWGRVSLLLCIIPVYLTVNGFVYFLLKTQAQRKQLTVRFTAGWMPLVVRKLFFFHSCYWYLCEMVVKRLNIQCSLFSL